MATKLNFLHYTYRIRINHITLYSQTFPGHIYVTYIRLATGLYEFHQKFFWTSPELHTKYSYNSCEFFVALYGNMHKCTVIHMKFIWRVILCQMQFIWMILTVLPNIHMCAEYPSSQEPGNSDDISLSGFYQYWWECYGAFWQLIGPFQTYSFFGNGTWWLDDMERFSALLITSEDSPQVIEWFPS